MNPNSITPAVIIYERDFKNTPLWQFETNNREAESLNDYENRIKHVVGYRYSAKKFLQTISSGNLFVFHVHLMEHKKLWDIHIWDSTGNRTVICTSFNMISKETDCIPNDEFEKILIACREYASGTYICSGCKTKTNHIAGHYFAGQYCQKCWDDKYKAIEARENYN
jgi:hypothetical protein